MIKSQITLGEGNTPIIKLSNIEKLLRWDGEVWAKAEYQNPTGSFKDRGSIVEISQAIIQNKKGVVCASTGNMAASLAAYAARAKLSCIVFVPEKTPEIKLNQALIYGARLIKIKGNYDNCVLEAEKISKEKNYLLCGDYELRKQGQSTLGWELAKSGICFNAYIISVGNGSIGCAIARGFANYKQYPKFIGIQGKNANPVVRAWKENSKIVKPVKGPKTIASAINVGRPLDGQETLAWIKRTNGLMISVTDKEILNAQALLSKKEGIYVETSAAATLAGLIKIKEKLKGIIILILTGSGLKEKSVGKLR